MDLLCPGDPTVWDGRRFGPCFADLVLGFAGNVVAAVAVVGLFLAKRNAPRAQNVRRGLSEKLFVFGVPGFAACLSLVGLTMLAKKKFEGKDVENYELFFMCSQFIARISVSLVCVNGAWFEIICNPIMCFCWILKILLEIPHLQYKLTLLKAMASFVEIVSFCTAATFGLFVIVAAVVGRSRNKRQVNSIEAPLIPNAEKSEGETTNLVNKDHNLWELLTFKFVNPMMGIGITRQLDFTDLLELPAELRAASCYDKLLSSWTAEYQNHHDKSSLLRAMSCAYGWTYLRLGLLKVINDSINFVSPLLLNNFIRFLQQGSGGLNGYVLAVSLGLTSIIKSLLDSQYSFRLAKLKLMLRSSIMGIVYRKCLCLSLAERSRFSEGEIQTFMSVDGDRTINLCNSLHDAWSLPLQIGIALYLLYTQVNYAFLSGLAITIILIPVNKWISTRIAGATEKMMKQKDGRISCAGELLSHIRTVKMYSWEKLFTERLVERRELEVKHLATRKYLDAWCVYFWATTPTLFSLFTFSIFAIMGHPLDAATVFTCVALFNTLISPLNSFPWVINGMIDAIISSRRLSNYLSTPEHRSSDLTASADLLNHNLKRYTEVNHNPMAVVLQNICCSWSSSSVVEPSIVLREISLQLQKGLFVAIVGEVGSGKSSLLNNIIGETRVVSGSISSCGSIAYVPQVPWILSGSLRDNILLGKEFDPRRYEEVLLACALDVDISAMARGDMSHIGEKGANLSGGQRARLALARALYHNSDVYLFDDILSAVDSQVASWILEKAIMGPQLTQKTRLLSTHNVQAISAADMIVVMANGLVKWFGTLEFFLATPYSRISKPDSSSPASLAVSVKDKTPTVSCELKTDVILEDDSVVAYEERKDQVDAEARKEGRVELSVYKKYATFAGWSIAILIFLSAFLMQASRNGNDLWLTYWVDTSTGTNNTRFYLIILAIFGIINSLFTLGRAFSFAFGGLRAAIHIHASLLESIISAPVCFFDQNPSGRILNRLSSDLYTVDDSLPFILNIFVANFFSLLGTLVVLSYSQVSFLLILLPLWLIYRKLQFYYRSTSREVRRLDSVARSPIYSSFTETLDGSSTIRAFQKEGFFLQRFIQHMTLYQKTSYSELIASLWLSLRLQLLAGFIILFIAMMATVSFHSNSLVNFGTPGLVGLALSYAAPVVSLLNGFLTTFTETEKEMISVERVVEYVGIPQEELQGSQSPPRSWPTEGKIEFEHVTLRYKPELPPALNDVSFLIASGMQVGIVGRTGAGKSSILNALFRLAPICNGRILVDSFDVSRVAVRDLRGHFAVVPQSPFLFDGSLRENLDPFNTATDLRIWEVLEKCHMKGEIESIGGLDIHVKASGASFSVGQRQLLCLARAILKSSKVLCLDECTANVDNQTAFLLQNTISVECKGMTVLTIAHRISTVMKTDNILVLDQGKLRDFFPKLVDIFKMCEDLENIDDLHLIFKLVKGIILLNSPSIFDKIFSDEFILDIIGALEYDPEVPRVQKHRAFLKDHVVFKEAIPIQNVSVVSKIHQTYRIGYLKDVILPRILDDATLASLNTMIHTNNASVISLLKDDALFIRQLFARMRSSDISVESKRELVLFLHEFCTLSKSLPLVQQLRLFRDLSGEGVFEIISDVLQCQDRKIVSAGTDILILFLNQDPNLLRSYIVQQEGISLLGLLVKGMVTDFGEEMHCQFLEILRILMDSFTMSGAHRDVIIDIFYERHLDYLVDVIASSCPPRSISRSPSNSVGVGRNADAHRIKPEILLNVCELLCFCVNHHPYRIKCNFLMNNAIEKILTLTRRREKFLVVAAVRFMRTIIFRNDEHLIRHVVKFNLLKPIIDAFIENGDRYNMLHSGVLELLEHIRKENIKSLVIYVIESFWDQLAKFEHFGSIQAFKLKYQQYLESAETRLSASVPDTRKKSEQRGLEKEEEDYFNEDSDEEDSGSGRRAKHAQNQHSKPMVPNGNEAGDIDDASRPKSAGLVDYDDDDDEDFNPPPKEPARPSEDDEPLNISTVKRKSVNAVDGKHADGEGRKRQKIETRISCAKIAAVTSIASKHTDLQNKHAPHSPTSSASSTEANGVFREHGTNSEEHQHSVENTETSRQTGDCIKNAGSMSSEKAVNTTNTSDSEPYSVR